MFTYQAYGLNIRSEIQLPELIKSESNTDAEIIFENLDTSLINVYNSRKHFKASEKGVFLLWKNKPVIKISGGEKICIDPAINIDGDLLRNLLLGTALAVLRHQQGLLVLHASSVNIKGDSVAFLGDVGQGKSTTAFALNKNGHPLISDDILPIHISEKNLPFVYPGYPRLRLTPKFVSYIEPYSDKLENEYNSTKKLIYSQSGFSSEQIPLKAAYILEKGENFEVKRLSQKEALINLIKNSYCLPVFNNLEKKRNFIQCANIVKDVPVKKLTVKNSLDKLPELVKIIENDFNNSN